MMPHFSSQAMAVMQAMTNGAKANPSTETTVLNVRVYGIPKGQPRARAFAMAMGGGKFSARVYDAGTAEGWKGDIALAFKDSIPTTPIDVPCRVDALFLFPRPQRLLKKKSPEGRIPYVAKPDRDNADKALLDTLTRLGFWTDDNLAWAGWVVKMYVAKGERPGAIVRIEPTEDASPFANVGLDELLPSSGATATHGGAPGLERQTLTQTPAIAGKDER